MARPGWDGGRAAWVAAEDRGAEGGNGGGTWGRDGRERSGPERRDDAEGTGWGRRGSRGEFAPGRKGVLEDRAHAGRREDRRCGLEGGSYGVGSMRCSSGVRRTPERRRSEGVAGTQSHSHGTRTPPQRVPGSRIHLDSRARETASSRTGTGQATLWGTCHTDSTGRSLRNFPSISRSRPPGQAEDSRTCCGSSQIRSILAVLLPAARRERTPLTQLPS